MMNWTILQAAFADPSLDAPAIVHHTQQEIVLDGWLSESFWQHATPVTTFQRYMPTDGGPPPGNTAIRFVQHDADIYIGIEVSNVDYPIQARISPREDVNDDDQIGIYLDTVGDGRTGYIFYLNPLGIQQDIRYSNGRWSVNWNTIFDTKGNVTEDGYTIEMVLPFKSLQYVEDAEWMVSMTRKVPSLGAKYSHPQRVRNHPQLFLQSVPLENLKPPEQGTGLWLQPTLSVRHNMERVDNQMTWTEQGAPLGESIMPSFDLRWGLNSESVLTATINPDFSQVEGDVRQINLNQRFAFFYPERRPFFLGNIDSFQDYASTLYTRSIVSPSVGAKVSGREEQWDYGVLFGLDQQPNASVHEFSAPGFQSEELAENWANTTYLRLRRDALQSGFIGLYFSDKTILLPSSTTALAHNDVGGIDFRSNISKDTLIQGFSSFSSTRTEDTALSGHRHKIQMSKTPDLGWGFNTILNASTPDFRQEMGFLTQSGLFTATGEIFHHTQWGSDSLWTPSLQVYAKSEWDNDGLFKLHHQQNFTIKGLHTVQILGGWAEESYQNDMVAGPFANARWAARVNGRLNTVLSYDMDTSLDYASGLSATNQQSSIEWLWRPQSNIRLDIDFAQQWYQIEEQDLQSIQRVYSRLNTQFSQYLGARVIGQTVISNASTGLDAFFGSLLVSYIRNPGNEIYVGGTWNWNPNELNLPNRPNTKTSADLVLQEQMLFAKWTHLFQY